MKFMDSAAKYGVELLKPIFRNEDWDYESIEVIYFDTKEGALAFEAEYNGKDTWLEDETLVAIYIGPTSI
jgi:hypothetical protein